MNPENSSLNELLDALKNKKITSVELVKFYLSKINELNSKFNIYLFVRDQDQLLAEAANADKERASGSTKKLLGIPFSVKDSFMALGTPTTAGDLYLKDTMSEYNATIVQKLLDEGAILLGKTNMDAWGFGGSTENSSYGVTKNPYDEKRVAGGSSGGAGASVALHTCTFAIGEDTGGSVRSPASYCGVFGLKPTYGRISRFGCIAYASSLDSVGVLSNSADDIARVFEVLQGSDGKDRTIVEYDSAYEISRKFAFSMDFIPEGISEETKHAYSDTIEKLKSLGFEAVEVSFPSFAYCIPTYYITAMCEASTNLARFQGTRYGSYSQQTSSAKSWEELFTEARTLGLNKEAKRRVFLGAYVSSEGYADAYYKKAQAIRNMIHDELDATLQSVDFILSPVTPTPAPRIGEVSSDPVKAYLEDIYTVTANLAGVPSLAFPVGKNKDGLPLGMQAMGKKGSDEKLLKIFTGW